MGEYDDIINLPYKGVKRHQPMKMEMRAAQFAPFAALTGHNAAIAATAKSHIDAFNNLHVDDEENNECRHDTDF